MPELPELNPVIHGKLRLALTEYVQALKQLLGGAIGA